MDEVDSTSAESRILTDAEYFAQHLQGDEGEPEVTEDSLRSQSVVLPNLCKTATRSGNSREGTLGYAGAL